MALEFNPKVPAALSKLLFRDLFMCIILKHRKYSEIDLEVDFQETHYQ